MKKRIAILLLVTLAAFLFTACSAADNHSPGYSPFGMATGGSTDSFNDEYAYSLSEPMASPEAPTASRRYENDSIGMAVADSADYGGNEVYLSASGGGSTVGGGAIVPVFVPINEGLAEKIIYSVHANIETMEFDESVAKVNQMLQSFNAFIENSSVSGINYQSRFYGWNEHRYAYFNIRVPVGNLNAMVDTLETLGNVTHRSNDAINITTQFHDTQSRLNSLKIQEERLLDMLKKADDVPDLIMIEERLSDVRYQVEILTTTLMGWQRQVDYSTVTLSLVEVIEFTEPPQLKVSYWEQISTGFIGTIKAIGGFFMDIFKWLIVSAPVLLIIAILVLVALIIIRKKIRAYKKKKSEQTEVAQEQADITQD